MDGVSSLNDEVAPILHKSKAVGSLKTVDSHDYLLLGKPVGSGGFSLVYLACKEGSSLAPRVPNGWRRKISFNSTKPVTRHFRYAVKICKLQEDDPTIDRKLMSAGGYNPQDRSVFKHVQVSYLSEIEEEVSFLRELRAAKNIVKLKEAFIFAKAGQCWIVTEALRLDLTVVQRFGAFDLPKWKPARQVILKNVCEALVCLKSSRIIHCDIKPSNVLLSSTGRVKLCDFGLARRLPEDLEHLVATDDERGSPEYMAPELLVSNAKYDYGVDLWSFGMLVVTSYRRGKTLFVKDNMNVRVHHRKQSEFGENGEWSSWKRHPFWYLKDFIGVFALGAEEHKKFYRMQLLQNRFRKPTQAEAKTFRDIRDNGTRQYELVKNYVDLLRKCLIPLRGTSPCGDPTEWPSYIKRGTIEEVLHCELFRSNPKSERKQRKMVRSLVRAVTEGA